MSINVINNFLSEEDIYYILSLPEVTNSKNNIELKINGSEYFSINLTPLIKKKIFEKFGLRLETVPMRWIKGDTKPHVDTGSKQFEKTYLAYLSDSPGDFLIENNSYHIVKGSAFIFNEGLKHETINTGLEPRLLLGPMSEEGLAVGAAGIVAYGGSTIYFQQADPGAYIEFKIDNSEWYTIFDWPTYVQNLTPETSLFINVEFLTDINISSQLQYFVCNSEFIQFGSRTLKNNGTRPKIIINNVSNYPGFINNSHSNINILNLEVNSTGTTFLADDAGWLCQTYFGNGATNNYIINCSSDGDISGLYCGGIVGRYAGYNSGNLTIIGCSSYGNIIGDNAGGIVGAEAENITVQSCWSQGAISSDGTGGIVGSNCSNAIVTNCYSQGSISGNNSGGMLGSNPGLISATIQNCYSTGNITGGNSGGICGSFGIGSYNVTIQNCYSTGNINGTNQAGGICGFKFSGSVVTISNCYTVGNATGSTGYIIAGSTSIPSTCYSEAGSGGTSGTWSNIHANATLIGTPNIGYSSSVWQTIHGTPTPYELFNMGYIPYSITNISGNNLIRTVSATVNAGNSTSSAIKTSGTFYTFLEDYTTPYEINIDNSTGVISTTSSTPLGTYTLYVYNTGSYNITTYILTVTIPPPEPNNNKSNETFPVQRGRLNQKSSFCGTRAVSATSVGIGAVRGKGSATRIFNNCKGNNSVNFKLCQFRVLGYK
jgi:hypothetical protein